MCNAGVQPSSLQIGGVRVPAAARRARLVAERWRVVHVVMEHLCNSMRKMPLLGGA